MFRLSQLSSAAALGNFTPSFQFLNFRKNFACAAIVLHFAYPVVVTTGTYVITTAFTNLGAFLNQICQNAISTLTLSYGEQRTYKPYAGVVGNELRTIGRYAMQRELQNNVTFTAGFYAVGSYTITFDFIIPWLVHPLDGGAKRLPGWTQMRSMFLEIQEGTAFSSTQTGTMARSGGSCTVDVDTLTVPAEKDQWTPLLSFYKINNSDYEVNGPDGIHLAAWDDNIAFSGTAITVYSLLIDTSPIIDTSPPYAMDDVLTDYWVDGGSNIDDTETVLLTARWNQRVQDLPAGKITVRQPALYVATLKLRGLYWPILSEAEATEATRLGSIVHGGAIKLHADSETLSLPDKHSRSAPAVFSEAAEPEFSLKQGIAVDALGAPPHVDVPAHVAQAVSTASAIGAQTGPGAQNAAEAMALKNVIKGIPGMAQSAVSAQGNRNILRGHLARVGVSLPA